MNIDVKDFETEVIKESFNKPVLVDFWAEWCGPCRILGPVLEKLASEQDNWILKKLNTDDYPEIASRFGIRGIPNVKLFSKGEVINEFTGALPENMVREWLKKALPGKFSDKISEAEKLLNAGNTEKAKSILTEIYNHDRNDEQARLLLAKIILFDQPEQALELVKDLDGDAGTIELSEAITTLAELVNRDNPKSLPDNHVKDKYLNAIKLLKNKEFDEALTEFINVIRENRFYDDDGARKACIAIFKYLGEENEITIKHRRDFGRALYV
ncbi:MAG: thioredoxin [Ignavibacteriaceae bacterium]